jgi:hypothetical protein
MAKAIWLYVMLWGIWEGLLWMFLLQVIEGRLIFFFFTSTKLKNMSLGIDLI